LESVKFQGACARRRWLQAPLNLTLLSYGTKRTIRTKSAKIIISDPGVRQDFIKIVKNL